MIVPITIPKFSNPFQFDMLILEPVHEMMNTGISIDQVKKKQLQEEAIEDWGKTQVLLNKCSNRDINVSSGPQVISILYTELGMPKKYKKKKLTTDEDALRAVMAECRNKVETLSQEGAKDRWRQGYVVCQFVLKIRGLRKEISSYLGLHIDKGVLAGPSDFEDEDAGRCGQRL